MRTTILAAAFAFLLVLGGLTVAVAVEEGPDILTVASLLVLAMIASGVLGALRNPPRD